MQAPALDAMTAVAEVNLSALANNVEVLRHHVKGDAAMLVAVKADAYGHGLLPTARALADLGVPWFGVATPHEALELREARIPGRILVFGPQRGDAIDALADAGVDVTVTTLEDVAALEERLAGRSGEPLRVHVKVNTGMARLGLSPAEALPIAREVARRDGLRLEGVWTHFARADEVGVETTDAQLAAFEAFLGMLEAEGVTPTLRHAANSAATLTRPDAHFDLVRPGISVYGYPPSADLDDVASGLVPVMHVHAPVVFTQAVRAGTPVSYGHRWTAPVDTNLVTVRFGYADGYPRSLTNLGDGSVNGHRVRVVGTVCMDQILMDVGDATVRVGDRVSLLGGDAPGADALAARVDSIAYELLTRISPRVERRYVND